MSHIVEENQKIVLDKEYFIKLEKKAALLEDFLSYIEEKSLGYLMQETEKEKNISLPKAKKLLK